MALAETAAAVSASEVEWESELFCERSFAGELRLEGTLSSDKKLLKLVSMTFESADASSGKKKSCLKFEAVFNRGDLERCGFPLALSFKQNADTIKLAFAGKDSFIKLIPDFVIVEDLQRVGDLSKTELALMEPYFGDDLAQPKLAMRLTVSEETHTYNSLSYLLLPTAVFSAMDALRVELKLAHATIDELRAEVKALKLKLGDGSGDEKKEDLDYISCTFDPTKTNMDVSADGKTVTHKADTSRNWQTALCHEEFSNGQQSFEVVIGAQHWGSGPWHLSVGVVKVGTMHSYANLVGSTTQTWGYMSTVDKGGAYAGGRSVRDLPTPFRVGDVVRVQCDFNARTLEYFINGTSVGAPLFTDLEGPVNPAVSLWQPNAEITIH